ncbi:nuclear transport factor 2 family protein [Nocardioides sp. SYSU D00038]|uniref:YybH family protein n=1 Tax=Nocardioides sp. SYSU D00038 TaxID=2812554 RepID=UPI001966E0D0|nr:nuclear transport factor 2 family protein [Nocardioides sp. SYSU D00038]
MGDEREIRDLVLGWAATIDAAGPLEQVLADHTDDIVMFDVPPPHDGARGLAAYADTWPPFLEYQRSGAVFEVVELDVTAGDDVAWAWALLRCGLPDELERHPDRRLRLTLGLRRQGARWQVAHEHHSFADVSGP